MIITRVELIEHSDTEGNKTYAEVTGPGGKFTVGTTLTKDMHAVWGGKEEFFESNEMTYGEALALALDMARNQ